MNAVEHAERILESWERSDSCLQDELLYALRTCSGNTPAAPLEAERREVLQSAVENMRALRGSKVAASADAIAASLALLRHLRQQPRSKAAGVA